MRSETPCHLMDIIYPCADESVFEIGGPAGLMPLPK
jgi:hypothetical protein